MTRNAFAAVALSALLGLGVLTAAGPSAAQDRVANCIWERIPQAGRSGMLAAPDEASAAKAIGDMAVAVGQDNLMAILAGCGVRTTEQSRLAGRMFAQQGLLRWAEGKLARRFAPADLEAGFVALTPADVAAMARLSANRDAALTDADLAAMRRFVGPILQRKPGGGPLQGQDTDALLSWLVTRALLAQDSAAYGRLPR